MGKKIQNIGKYNMDGVILGKGNFARVELGNHSITSIKVAIKVIDTKKIKEDYILKNLHREAKLMSQLRHPNIIRLYETMKAQTLYCLVLEFASGGDLLDYIKLQEGAKLQENDALVYFRQLLSALHYCHERSIVHRDLKMENIMLDETKRNVKLIDFGLSNFYKAEDPLKTHCGSPEYAAPELFVVGRTYGPEIDIWSLGIIGYAMVLGKLPFFTPFKDEYQRQRMLQQIQKGLGSYHYREMQVLSEECQDLLKRTIEPDPEVRMQLGAVEKHPWTAKNGSYPFYPYVAPAKDKLLRQQCVGELAFMTGNKRMMVEETVKDNRADELSAMYNMLMEKKKRDKGFYDHDHTYRKHHRHKEGRSKSQEPHKSYVGKGKLPRRPGATPKGKSAVVTTIKEPAHHSLQVPQAGAESMFYADGESFSLLPGTSSSAAPEKHVHASSHADHSRMRRSSRVGSFRRSKERTSNREEQKKPEQKLPNGSVVLANGPMNKVPPSQRRVPPVKLNLTLDLSTYSGQPKLSDHQGQECPKAEVEADTSSLAGSSIGVAASSGVKPKLSTTPPATRDQLVSKTTSPLHMVPRNSPSNDPNTTPSCSRQSSAESRAARPTTLRYLRSGLERVKMVTRQAAAKVIRKDISSLAPDTQHREDSAAEDGVCHSEDEAEPDVSLRLKAPTATPEDSTIISWNDSPSGDSITAPGPGGDYAVVTCQDADPQAIVNTLGVEHVSDTEGGDRLNVSSNKKYSCHNTSYQAKASSRQWHSLDSSADESSPRHRPHAGSQTNPNSSSTCQEGLSSDSVASLSQATRSQQRSTSTDSPLTHEVSAELGSDSSRAASSAALAPQFGSEPLSVGWAEFSPIRTVTKPHGLSLSNPGELNTRNLAHLGLHGISPSSPTYQANHGKFSHTGSHALDCFFSPDEPVSFSDIWSSGSAATYMLPTVDPVTPGAVGDMIQETTSSLLPCISDYSTSSVEGYFSQSVHSASPRYEVLSSPSLSKTASPPPRSILHTTPKRSVKSVHITLPHVSPDLESVESKSRQSRCSSATLDSPNSDRTPLQQNTLSAIPSCNNSNNVQKSDPLTRNRTSQNTNSPKAAREKKGCQHSLDHDKQRQAVKSKKTKSKDSRESSPPHPIRLEPVGGSRESLDPAQVPREEGDGCTAPRGAATPPTPPKSPGNMPNATSISETAAADKNLTAVKGEKSSSNKTKSAQSFSRRHTVPLDYHRTETTILGRTYYHLPEHTKTTDNSQEKQHSNLRSKFKAQTQLKPDQVMKITDAASHRFMETLLAENSMVSLSLSDLNQRKKFNLISQQWQQDRDQHLSANKSLQHHRPQFSTARSYSTPSTPEKKLIRSQNGKMGKEKSLVPTHWKAPKPTKATELRLKETQKRLEKSIKNHFLEPKKDDLYLVSGLVIPKPLPDKYFNVSRSLPENLRLKYESQPNAGQQT